MRTDRLPCATAAGADAHVAADDDGARALVDDDARDDRRFDRQRFELRHQLGNDAARTRRARRTTTVPASSTVAAIGAELDVDGLRHARRRDEVRLAQREAQAIQRRQRRLASPTCTMPPPGTRPTVR